MSLRYAEADALALAETLRRDRGFETETLLGARATGIEVRPAHGRESRDFCLKIVNLTEKEKKKTREPQ